MHWIIDTDAGVDDAIAIVMPFAPWRYPDFHLLALTTVAGNVHVDKVNVNAGAVLDLVDADVPIFAGCDRPLIAAHEHAEEFHGADGLGDAGLSKTERRPESEHAAIAICRLAREFAGGFGIVMLGPLTNLALACNLDPNLPQRVSRLVVMGGAWLARGNQTSAAEFNIYGDPESARVVFDRFPRVSLLPWELSLDQGMPFDRLSAIAARPSPRARFLKAMTPLAGRWLVKYKFKGVPMPDPLAVAIALDEAVIRRSVDARLRIDIGGDVGRGLTSLDYRHNPPNTRIVVEIDADRAWDMIEAAWSAG
jgi:purine nucleosidase